MHLLWIEILGFLARNWQELIGFVTGALCVWLLVRQNIWNWPVGITNNIFYIIIFYNSGLYADAGLQFVYIAISIYGWWNWLHGGQNHSALTVNRASFAGMFSYLGITATATAVLYWLLRQFTPSTVPLADGLTTALFLTAQYMMSRKVVENWWFWIIGDVLKTLSSFYVTNDRNYSYVGIRGFERGGDYNSRVLLLLNGLRTNDNVSNQAYIAEEFSVDVDLIERVEVIRGPSSAIYGSNAFFAVINVVTRPGSSFAGTEIATTAASFGTYSGRGSYGHSFANGLDLVASGTYSDGKGRNLFFPEYDAPATNNGMANGADHEGFRKLLVTASKGNFAFQANNVSREKGLPTGVYAATFNDPRSSTTDGLSLASLTYERAFDNAATFSTRLHAGRYTYDGEYAYTALAPNKDIFVGEWWGLDIDAACGQLRRSAEAGAGPQ
jgi:nicotinamide mononucleotide transporter PnuC